MTPKSNKSTPHGWEPLADWYDGWMGAEGSIHHRQSAIPTVLELLALQSGETVLDIGAGQGVLAPHIKACNAIYTGVEISEKLLRKARQRHRDYGRFLMGDARHLRDHKEIHAGEFDAAVFLLSIQDMNPLDSVIASTAWALNVSGRIIILMTHPCFRVPRQSGWGDDVQRRLRYRRIDSYLTPLNVPLKSYGRRSGKSISFHRPLNDYVNTLAKYGFVIDALREIVTHEQSKTKSHQRANSEIPLFLGLRGRKSQPVDK